MPTIRTVRPTDIFPLISFLRGNSHVEVTARVWPVVREDAGRKRLREFLPRLIVRAGTRSRVWVYLARGGIRGLLTAQSRAGKLAWDVEELLIVRGERSSGVELLDHLANQAMRKGARRIFIAVPRESDLERVAGQAGFRNYTSESVHFLQLTAAVSGGRPARPRLRHDTQALFQLYNAAVPCRVRSAEAMTIEEWLSLEKGTRPWAPSLTGSRQQLVWERANALMGWLRITFGSRSQHLELLVNPSCAADAEDMVLYALSQVSHRVPVYFTVREYQPEVRSALERQGFSQMGGYLLFVRELAARVPARGLVPARA